MAADRAQDGSGTVGGCPDDHRIAALKQELAVHVTDHNLSAAAAVRNELKKLAGLRAGYETRG